MSKGAMKELGRAGHKKFTRLTKDIPHSEKREIIKYLATRIIILKGLL